MQGWDEGRRTTESDVASKHMFGMRVNAYRSDPLLLRDDGCGSAGPRFLLCYMLHVVSRPSLTGSHVPVFCRHDSLFWIGGYLIHAFKNKEQGKKTGFSLSQRQKNRMN